MAETKKTSYPQAMQEVTNEMTGQKVLSNKLQSGTIEKDWKGYEKGQKLELPIFKAKALRKMGVFKF